MDVKNLNQGSFGIPDNVRAQLEKQRVAPPQATPPVAQAQQPVVAAPAEAPVEKETLEQDLKEAKSQKAIEDLRDFWEKRLEVTITPKDVRDYIFRGRLIKDNIVVIPGYMKARFQSLNPEELEQVDNKMSEFRDKGKFTQQGLDNENAIQVLSYGWLASTEIGDDGKDKPSKPMGATWEDRYGTVKKVQALAVQEVIEAWDGFQTLIKIALREKRLLKKH